MKKNAISETCMDDEYPEVTQADFDRAVFRRGLKPDQKKHRITIMLDVDLIDHFKARAGKRGYQTLINDTLRRAITTPSLSGSDMEGMLRQIIREELSAAKG